MPSESDKPANVLTMHFLDAPYCVPLAVHELDFGQPATPYAPNVTLHARGEWYVTKEGKIGLRMLETTYTQDEN